MSGAKTAKSPLADPDALEAEGDWSTAATVWRARLAEDPTGIAAWGGLARTSARLGRWDEAEHFLRVAALNARSDQPARNQLASTASGLGFGVLALELLSTGADADSLLQRSELQLELKAFPDALKSANAALAAGADPAKAVRLASEARARHGDVAAARAALRDHLIDNPDDLEAEALSSRLLFQVDSPEMRAYRVPQTMLAAFPSLESERNAALAEHDGDLQAALDHYEQAANLGPGIVSLWRKLSVLALRQHDLIAARRASLRMIEISPCDPDGYLTLASTSRTPDEDLSVVERLERYAAHNPYSRTVLISFFNILVKRRDYNWLLAVAASLTDVQLKGSQSFSIDVAEAQSGSGELAEAIARLRAIPAAAKAPQAAVMILRIARAARSLTPSDLPLLLLHLWPSAEVAFGVFDLLRRQRDLRAALGWAEAFVQWQRAPTPAQWQAFVGVAATAGRTDLVEAWCAAGGVSPPLRTSATAERLPLSSREAATAYRDLQARLQLRKPSPERYVDASERLLSYGHRAHANDEILAGLRRFPDDRRLLEASLHLLLLEGDVAQAVVMLGLLDAEVAAVATEPPPVLLGALAQAMRTADAPAADALARVAADFAEHLLDNGQVAAPLFGDMLAYLSRYGQPEQSLPLARRTADAPEAPAATLQVAAEILAASEDRSALQTAERAAAAGATDAILLAARLASSAGAPAQAERLLRAAVVATPRSVPLLDALSASLEALERWDAAISVGRQAYVAGGSTAARGSLLAKLLLRAGKLDEAIGELRRAATAWPDDRETHALLGACLAENGALADADAALDALALRLGHSIDSLELHVQVRYLRMDYGGAQALVAASDLALDATPQVLRRLGWLHRRLTNAHDALQLTRAAVDSRDGDVTAQSSLVEMLQDAGQVDEAMAAAVALVAENPLRERAHVVLGGVYKLMGDTALARRSFECALALSRHDNAALTQLSLLEEEAGDFAAALALLELWLVHAARTDQPAGVRVLWHAALNAIMLGDIERALALHAQQCAAFDETLANLAPVWSGERLDSGALVIAMRGGPGDELRIATMALPWLLADRAATVRFACDVRVQSLLQRTFPEVEFIPVPSGHRQLRRKATGSQKLHDRMWPGVTARITDMATPFGHVQDGDHIASSDTLFHHAFFETVMRSGGTLQHRFLKPDQDRRDEMSAFLDTLGPGLRVGVCWRGSYRSTYRNRIFLEIDEIASLFDLDVRFVDLQVNKDAYERGVATAAGLVEAPDLDLYDDFEGMAALMSGLDLIVTPGMTMRDLAGALNVPVFSTISAIGASDQWRKQADGTDRWQPSIRHFDVTTAGSRSAMVLEVREAIAQRAAAASAARG